MKRNLLFLFTLTLSTISFSEREILLTEISDFIEFEGVKTTTDTISVRPDIWVFPFLDVYGIFGKLFATTKFKLVSPIAMQSIVYLEVFSSGVPVTGAYGMRMYIAVMDSNRVCNSYSIN